MVRESGGPGISTGANAKSDAIGVDKPADAWPRGRRTWWGRSSLGGDAPVGGVGADFLTLSDGGLDGADGTGEDIDRQSEQGTLKSCPIKISERIIFVKVTAHPVPPG
jgi:hypothetical protein